jgi:hypothetical protein
MARRTRPNIAAAKKAELPSWHNVYKNRTYLGHVRVADCDADYWLAFDHRGVQVGGRHRGIDAAVAAVPPRRKKGSAP